MSISLGAFHGVLAVGQSPEGLTILDRYGVEKLIMIDPPLTVSGAFGSFENARGAQILEGLDLPDVTTATITVDYEGGDFHRRHLVLSSPTYQLDWELYCDGTL